MTAAPIDPDTLRQTAVRLMGHYPHWPRDVDVVLADPFFGRLVRLNATHGPWHPVPGQSVVTPLPRPLPQARSLPPLRSVAVFDHKRAASGERDDD